MRANHPWIGRLASATTLTLAFARRRRSRRERRRAQCVDEELKEELVGGRHYRGVEDRLFTKAFRHELSVTGGYYAADLYSSNWVVGGAYTFHFSEDLALEASYQYTRFTSAVTSTYERRFPQISLEESTDKPGNLYFGPPDLDVRVRRKLRWMGGGISHHFDFNFALRRRRDGRLDCPRPHRERRRFGTKFFFGK